MTTSGGTRTFMFTDLVSSTQRMAELGEAETQRLYLDHLRLLRRIVTQHGGQEIKNQGDGLMCAFASALDAVDAAVAMQQTVHEHNQASPNIERLGLRVGLHSGETLTHEGDYFGMPVVVAQRLSGHAQGGQIVVSEVVRALAGGRSDQTFRDIGPLALKGVPEAVAAFEIAWSPDAPMPPQRDRAVSAVPFPANLMPRADAPFVGRVDELRTIAQAWERVRGGNCRLTLLSGEPGIGKTTVAAHFCSTAGAIVLYGRCDEEQLVPYQPFAEALRHYVRFTPTVTLRGQLGPLSAPLTKLLPELIERTPDLATAPAATDEPEGERYRLYDAARSFLAEVASSPCIVVLDNLHWADKATLLLLRYILRSQEAPNVLFLGTYRATDINASHPLAELIADLRRDGSIDVIELHGLDENEIIDLIAPWTGAASSQEISRAVHSSSGGNPFFAVEIMDHMAQAGAFGAGGDVRIEQIGIPQNVRQAIMRRVGRLSQNCNRLLTLAAVLGQEFELDLIRDIARLDELTLVDAVEEGLGAGLLAQSPDPGSGRFAHVLFREALYDELNVARRAALHRQAAEALRQRYEEGRDRFLAPLAYHMAQAADSSNAEQAVRYAELAAERAARQVAHDEAVRFYELALRAIAIMEEPDEAERCRLLIALGRARYRAGEGPAAGQAFQDAATLAKRLKRPDLLGQAALGFGEVRQLAGFVDQPLIALLREALGALDQADSPLRARLLARLTAALYHSATHEELMRLAAASVEMARRLYDARTLLAVLLQVHFYRFAQRDVRSRLAAANELLELAEKIGDRDAALAACRHRIIDLLEEGDAEALEEGMRAYSERALESRQPLHIHLNVLCRAMRALLDGAFEEAEGLAREALDLGRDAQDDTAIASQAFVVQLFGVRKEQGRLGELEGVVASLVEQYPALPSWRVALAHIYSETGKLKEARQTLTPISGDNFAGLPDDYNRPIGLALLAETCATLRATDLADGLYELLLPLDRRCAVAAGMSATVGSASRHLGLLATTMGRWDDAERHFADALEQNTRLQAPPLVAHTQRAWASMLLARGDAADRTRAFEMLRAAGSTASRLGMQRLSEVTTGLLATAPPD